MYHDIASNKRRTVIIMVVFIAFVGAIAWLFDKYLGGQPYIFYGVLVGAVIYAVITYFAGSRMALAVNGAREIKKADNPRLWRIIENLSITDGLPMPRVYLMDDPSPNALLPAVNRKVPRFAPPPDYWRLWMTMNYRECSPMNWGMSRTMTSGYQSLLLHDRSYLFDC